MKIVELSTRRRVTIGMFTVAILLFGMVSLSRLKTNLLPDLSYPTITVRTALEGAAPTEVENLISRPVEEAVGVVKNMKQVRSVSRTSQSDVVLEFDWGTDMDYASLDVREKLDALNLPLEAGRPIILRFDPSLDPIQRYALIKKSDKKDGDKVVLASSDSPESGSDLEQRLVSLRRLSDELIKKDLESGDGVAAVKISGGLEDEIQVFVDQNKLSQLSIPIEEVASVLRSENVNLSGGALEEGTQRYLVRTLNQFQSIDEIGDVVVTTKNGAPIYLRDIATVEQSYSEREAIARLAGEEAVEIAIYKEGDANTVSVAESVDKRVERLREEFFPADIEMVKVFDQSVFIKDAVNGVVISGLIGGLLAMLVLYLFLQHFWTTLIISVSIPTSVIATFNMMYGADITLNIMSLGGLALGIGLLVDNSIVVLENIARYREKGNSVLQSAMLGTSEVGNAVIASTLTTVAVFLPMVFVKGIAGQLFRDQALTVTFSLLASLVLAITLIPMLASTGRVKEVVRFDRELPLPENSTKRFFVKIGRFLKMIPAWIGRAVVFVFAWIGKGLGFILSPLGWVFQKSYSAIEGIYPSTIRFALNNRLVIVGSSLVLFAFSVWLIPRIGIELIPQLSQGEFNVEFRMPPGTPIHETDRVISRAQLAVNEIEGVDRSFAAIGSGNRLDANPDQGGENWGELNVQLGPNASRLDENRVMDNMRGELRKTPGLQYKFGRPTLFSFDTPVEVYITGFDLKQMGLITKTITSRMDKTGRFADVKSSMREGHPEVQIVFDRDRAAALGVPVHQIAKRVVDNVKGDVATQYSWRDRKIDVLVRAQESDRASIDRIRNLIVNPRSERPVPLQAVADVQINTGPGEINRISQQRVSIISSNLNFGDLGAAAEELQGIIDTIPMPQGISARISGQNEEMSDSFLSLVLALVLAVFLVYLVMASQFESLLHPFVILFTIPLALIGAVLALWITGSKISVVVFIGLIMLAGIVVNNAIVLIDLINQLREDGMEKMKAIVEGGRLRLRPILMTTLTTALGLLPLAVGFGDGAEVRAPMAITVIGGLMVSTILTLVVIPVVYSVFDRSA